MESPKLRIVRKTMGLSFDFLIVLVLAKTLGTSIESLQI